MINERAEERAVLYVLDLLSVEERRDFEVSMERDPELQRRVREFTASLHAPVRELDGPSRPDLLAGILDRVDGSPESPVSRPVPESEGRSVSLPWAHIWAAAALLFLFLNIGLLALMNRSSSASGAIESELAESRGLSGTSLQSTGLNSVSRSLLEAHVTRLEESLAERDATLREINNERFELKAENDEVKNYNAGWQREYARLASRFLPFFEGDNGLSRFTVIEMVDADALRDGLPRLGFNELAAQYLTGEANIAGVSSDAFVGPLVEGAGVSSTLSETSTGGLTPIAQGDYASVAFSEARTADILPEPPGEVAGEESGQRPAGFTVWRDDEQKGFLDLYNLPEPVDGEDAFLWVRSGDLDPYIPVGAIPDLNEGTGSLFYSVEEPNFTPTEILITSEPPDTSASEPSGPILLRGP